MSDVPPSSNEILKKGLHMLKPGIYEQAITRAIREELQREDIIARTEKMDAGESCEA